MTAPPSRCLDPSTVGFLTANRDVVLFCRDRAGRPIGYPMRTVGCTAAVVTFTTYRKSAKVRHVERDGAVCVLAYRPAEGRSGDVRWVTVNGMARVVAPTADQIDALFPGPRDDEPRDAGDGRVPPGMGDLVRRRLRDGKRVLIEVWDLESAPGPSGRSA